MALEWPFKDPDEVLDYELDWTARLAGDTISTSVWLVPDELTPGAESVSGAVTKLWLSGGTIGGSFLVTNRITTAGGRTMDESVKIRVRSR